MNTGAATGHGLVARVAAGDVEALGEAYDLHGALVYSLALRMLGRPEEAEDLLQDVFLELWDRADRFDPARSTLAGFLVVMTRSRAIDRIRSRRARDAATARAESGAGPCGPLELASGAEARRQVTAALDGLPQDERRVLELAYFDGLSQSQIAETLHAPLGTVKGRARSGLRRLRERLPREMGGVR